MPATNGHGPHRAILHASVSREGQARTGFSFHQLIKILIVYAARKGYEILEEGWQNLGQSGALPWRGRDLVRDLLAAGGVSVVLAQDRARFAREPAYLSYLLLFARGVALDLPGVPEDAWLEELPAMKAADCGCVGAIAAHASLDPDDLLEVAQYKAGCEARGAAIRKEVLGREISRKVRERTLPDEKTFAKISRYEAHLSRQLYQALHELENLQKHRTSGEGVPLLRLDVQGLSED